MLWQLLPDLAVAALAPAEVAKRHHRASIVADEIRIVKHAAAQHNVVFVMGHAHVVLPKNLPVWHLPRRVLLEIPYKARSSCTALLVVQIGSAHCYALMGLAFCPCSAFGSPQATLQQRCSGVGISS